MLVRGFTLAAVALAVIAVGFVMFGGPGAYHVSVTIDNAGQLVPGNEVKVGGIPVGKVEDIELTRDARATLRLSIQDDELAPLRRGTKATVRSTSLSGIASRYVALTPGPNDAGEIPDGGQIPGEDTQLAVDLDQLLNTLDASTQRDLDRFIQGASQLTRGHEKEAGAGLRALNPALSQSAQTAHELAADQRALERFVVESADVSTAVASRPADLDQLVQNAATSIGALSRHDASLDSALRRLPPVLRSTNTTLVNLRSTLAALRPAVREAKPVAPLLSATLELLQPVAREARPLLPRLRVTVERGLLPVLERLPALAGQAVPAFVSTVKVLDEALPVLREARPYTPDVVGGLFNGFGGTTAGYYDANGHYVRISFQGSAATAADEGTLLLPPAEQDGTAGYRTGVDKRCPGAATQPAADASNPWMPTKDFPCDTGDSPR